MNISHLLNITFVFCLLKVDLSKLRYFYIDEMDAHFVNKVDREQKQAHRKVSLMINIYNLTTITYKIGS